MARMSGPAALISRKDSSALHFLGSIAASSGTVSVSCDDGLCASLANMLLIRAAFPVLQAPHIGFFDGIVLADCQLSDAETIVKIPQQCGRSDYMSDDSVASALPVLRRLGMEPEELEILSQPSSASQQSKGHSEQLEEPVAAAPLVPKVTLVVPHRTTYCSECETPIKAGHMARHNKQVHSGGKQATFPCPHCGKVYQRKWSLHNEHKCKKDPTKRSVFCQTCQGYFRTEKQLVGHKKAGRCLTKKCQRCGEMVYPRTFTKHLEDCQVELGAGPAPMDQQEAEGAFGPRLADFAPGPVARRGPRDRGDSERHMNGPGEPTNPPGRHIQQAVDGERSGVLLP